MRPGALPSGLPPVSPYRLAAHIHCSEALGSEPFRSPSCVSWCSRFRAGTLDSPPARHTEHVARPFSIADNRSLLADAVHCRHGSKLMAVPRGVLGLTAMPPRPVGRLMRTPTRTRAKRGPRRGSMCGGDRAPSAPVFAAVEADARRIAKWAARCPVRCGTRHSVRGEPLPSRA